MSERDSVDDRDVVYIVETRNKRRVVERSVWPDHKSAERHQRWMADNYPSKTSRIIDANNDGRLVPSEAWKQEVLIDPAH